MTCDSTKYSASDGILICTLDTDHDEDAHFDIEKDRTF